MAIYATYAKPGAGMTYVIPLWAVASVAHQCSPNKTPAHVVRNCPSCASARIIASGYREGQLACLAGIRGASLVGSFDCSFYSPESDAYRLADSPARHVKS